MPEAKTYLTKEKLEELKKQVVHLKNVKRREVAQRIHDAKELGDLSENAEYTEAKDDQAWTEGKILELEDVIIRSVIIENNGESSGTVRVGSKLKVKNGGQEKDFEICGSQEASPLEGKISNESPLGKAFLGKKEGDEVEIEVPMGLVKYKIVAVS
ncbi:transcription elongation factor GreA [Candidatus Falkowbacteria bacterium]|nr:transcription elongation factor GreA [Candidatus Falkowbacteria bacterium]